MKKYFIITYGCQMNESDSSRLGQYLDGRGWSQARDVSEADLIFFNACSVRQSAVDRLYARIKNLKLALRENGGLKIKNAEIILIGCILPKDKIKFTNLGVKIRRIEQLPLSHSDTSTYIPIMRGCNNWCSYCAVPLTKGHERCRPAAEIIAEVKRLVATGHQGITLLGQNVNSYQSPPCHSERGQRFYKKRWRSEESRTKLNLTDNSPRSFALQAQAVQVVQTPKSLQTRGDDKKSVDFADLLKIINNIPGNFKIRFLTNHPKDMSDKLIQTIARCDKVIKEIHLPFQSGDDAILKAMNRHYTKQYYLDLVKKIKLVIPNVKITTDIIVGFSGETEKQFQETVDIVKKVGFFKAYISKYSPRPGTVASRLADNIPMAEKKRREQILRQLIK